MSATELAQLEYERLRALIGGRHPRGDCQLVSLMIARVIEGRIIEGDVSCDSGKQIWHYWACDRNGTIYDPLAASWDDSARVYMPRLCIEEETILNELRTFAGSIDYIPPNYENPLFPLRYMLTKELIGVDIPDLKNLVL